ncbi:MAG TPA: hypothetical protein VGA99_10450 [bacterium]
MQPKKLLILLCLSGFVDPASPQDRILTDIRDLAPEEIKIEGFKLSSEQDVAISAVGFRGSRKNDVMFTNAWILDSKTRDVVWEMYDANATKKGRRLLEYSESLQLPAGAYEVYYATYPYFYYQYDHGWGRYLGKFWDDIFDSENVEDLHRDFKDELRTFRIEVRGRGERFEESHIANLNKEFTQNAIIEMTGLGDEEYLRQGFSLDRPLDLEIYAVGEARDDGTFDYSWIVNTKTRDSVWKMTYRNTDYAGGAKKNRKVHETVSLPAGRYVVFFVSDDSHSFQKWNASPPYDPMFWGITIKVKDASLKQYVKTYDYEGLPEENVIVKFTRLRDNEFKTQGFTLKRPADLRIYALGEGRDGQMFDYGWIVAAKTNTKVWEMNYYDTEHAGGDEKNRLVDEVRRLEKGSYIVYFVTDDSHSYWDWNTAPPHDQERWGITIYGADDDFDPNDIGEYEPRAEGNILAQIVRVGDHERERERFTLDNDSAVRIYAIGEGADGRMFDYGWVEDAGARRVVWEMTYRTTRYAGGADKNRVFDQVIDLRKGEYILYYESDDSHSFNNWNSDPPDDPVNWGITLSLVKN